MLALSKLPAATWASYVEGMAAGESLARLAARCGVCVKTSWFMRMRVLEAMRSQLQPMRGGDGISVNVNPSFTDSTNAIAPIAPTHPRRFRRRQAPFPASRSGARSFVR